MYMTANPCADAERWEDHQEQLQARFEADLTTLSNSVVDALQWGPDEPVTGTSLTAAEVIQNVMEDNPEHVTALIKWAAEQPRTTTARKLVDNLADSFARQYLGAIQ